MLSEHDLTACIESRRARLTRMAASMLQDAAEAEDVVQESALRALRGRERFRSEADVCTWFQRICINSCREAARKRASEQNRLDAARREERWRDPAYSVDPEAVAMALESGDRLKKALASLTPDQRLAVVLPDLQGWKAREIADDSDLPLATVKSHLRR
ncbi:MAG TPA: RNA polymerase sigma factor, partial [Candidatus Dormibacteraeota bacterium]|nr:RNA polymerase sigma factor [Candidatus Dormibacteraeota bacterium]